MKEGTVKFFNNSKGFGFIKPNDSSEDIFVHQSGLIDDIQENDRVEYELERGKKGMNAVRVKLMD
jgi:CspA family cold shock protein